MIASFRHNFIFIKTKKTAGTAVEMALAPVCGPDDIITPLGIRGELARGGGQPLCRNFAAPEVTEAVRAAMTSRKRHRMAEVKKLGNRSAFYGHMPASVLREKLPADFWAAAYKITAERHPYEKAVSQAYFCYEQDRPFEEFLEEFIGRGKYSSFEFYSIDGEVVVDTFLRQESLADDLARLGRHLGIPIPAEIPQAKIRSRADRRPAREILTDAQKETVYRFCRREFELLGYEP